MRDAIGWNTIGSFSSVVLRTTNVSFADFLYRFSCGVSHKFRQAGLLCLENRRGDLAAFGGQLVAMRSREFAEVLAGHSAV